jgi:hypothetical protein
MRKLDNVMKIPMLAALLIAGGAVGAYASIAAADTTSTSTSGETRPMPQPHIDGTISAIDGTTITIIAAENHGGGTYTINASSASVMKDGASSSVSALTVGDRVMALGTVSGTNVVATKVISGKFGHGWMHGHRPGVMGQVTAVNGTTLTIAGKDGTTYSVDAGSATVEKTVTESVSDIQIGDTIAVSGEVSGNTVTAKHVRDGLRTPPASGQ